MVGSRPLIFLIDTSALVGGLPFAAPEIKLATTPTLVQEMRSKGLDSAVQILLDSGKLRILEPTEVSIKVVASAAKALGDFQYLSEPDQQLLALALDLAQQGFHVVVLTNDYSIQNVAKHLSIEFRPAGERGIHEKIQWVTYCPGCWRRFPKQSKGQECPYCGTALKRRAAKNH